MRASTLLGLALALIVGLVVVAGIRFSGIFSRPAVVPPPKVEPVMVLAAKQNLYKGTSALATDVGTRPATEEEIKLIRSDPEFKTYLPPLAEAAHGRKLKRNVSAYALLTRDDFEAMEFDPSVAERLGAGMRAVDLVLPPERAGAGLLRLDERVDVYLTTTACTDAAGSNPRTAIAPIASDLKIIVKRGMLAQVILPVPKDEPVNYILEANPYRAALIEFAKTRGNITLVASSRQTKLPDGEAEKEQELVDGFVRGDKSVSEMDLERIFRLPPLPAVMRPLKVETYYGNNPGPVMLIQSPVPGTPERFEGGYRFFIPSESPQMARLDTAKKDNVPAKNVSVQTQAPPKKK